MLLVSYIQQYFNTSITVLTNQVWKLLLQKYQHFLPPPPPPPPPESYNVCSYCSVCVFRVVFFVLYCSVPYTFCSCKILLYFCSCKLYLCCKSKDYILFIRKIIVSFLFLIWGIHTLQACLFSGFLRFQVHNLFSMTDIMCYFYIDIYFIYMYFKSEYN